MMKMFFLLISLNFLTFIMNKKNFMIFILNFMLMLNIIIMMFNNFMNFYWMKINYILGMDYISLNLLLLTVWIVYLSLYSNNNLLLNNFKMKFLNVMLIMVSILFMCFCSLNMIMFYIFFEASLIPIMFIIMGWGYQIDRIQASMYMLFYTLVGSLPLLIVLMYMYINFDSVMFNIITMKINNNMLNNLMFYILLIMAFLIKMPMYMFHLWLPKAHVEAPISGSMILAGIMLKLGCYGLYRMINVFQYMCMNLNYLIIMFSLMGGVISSLICLNQNDMKIIVAYSSVVHMSVLMSGLLTMMYMGMMGSLMMMIAHGLCSSGMFYLVNINYERLKSRILVINKGMLNLIPSVSLWWFLIYTSNFSAPYSLNLFSEILLFNSLVSWNNNMIVMVILISFFSTCYSIMIYAFSQYGKNGVLFMNFNMVNCREFLIFMLLWLPLNLLFLSMNLMY